MKSSRIALAAALLLAGATPILAQSGAPAAAGKARYAPWGVDLADPRHGGEARRRFQPLCQRPLAAEHRDPGRPHQLEPVDRPFRGDRAADPRDRHRRRRLAAIRGSARSAISMPPGWTRPASRRAAPRRSAPISSGSTRSAAATTCSPCSRRPATPRRSGSASFPISPIRPTIPRSPARAASACPTATITCARARNMTPTAPPIAPT